MKLINLFELVSSCGLSLGDYNKIGILKFKGVLKRTDRLNIAACSLLFHVNMGESYGFLELL